MLLLPLFCLVFYLKPMRKDDWVHAFVSHYGRSMAGASILYVLSLVVTAVAAFFIDYPLNVARYVGDWCLWW